jgi:hypothetical protein
LQVLAITDLELHPLAVAVAHGTHIVAARAKRQMVRMRVVAGAR